VTGLARPHALIAKHAEGLDPEGVLIGIETDRGPWVTALVAAGYTVFAVNPRQVARYRERHAMSGAKSAPVTRTCWPTWWRTDAHQLRVVAGDSALVEGIKLVARGHQTVIWNRQRHLIRLRAVLRDFFPAALEAFDDLAGADALELLERGQRPGEHPCPPVGGLTCTGRR
jgi:hypothetical protein